MAKRLTSRLSAGAALVTGIGMMGIATAVPAQAATADLDYECTYTVLNIGEISGDNAVSVQLDADLPESAQVGDVIDPEVTATVTIPDSRRDSLHSLLSVRAIDGPGEDEAAAEDGDLNQHNARNVANFTLSNGAEAQDGTIPLEIPRTDVPDSGDLVVTAEGMAEPVTVGQTGTYTLSAGDFQGYIRGYNEAGDYVINVTLDCTLASTDATVGTVTVEESAEDPTEPTDPADPTEPTDPGDDGVNPGDDTDPGTDPGDDGANPGDDTDPGTDPGDDGANPGDDTGNDDNTNPGGDTSGAPEVPEVVQTDGLTPVQMAEQDGNTAALALGGLLVAGAGAGTILVARRRAQQN